MRGLRVVLDAVPSRSPAATSLTRNLSTMLNGLDLDENQFRRDVDHMIKNARATASRAHPAGGATPTTTSLR